MIRAFTDHVSRGLNLWGLALAQALLPHASITLRGPQGHFVHTPDLHTEGRIAWLVIALTALIAGVAAMGS